MPLYDYQCFECDFIMEMIVPAGETLRYDCPECEARASMRRIFSAGGVYLGNQDTSWLKTVGEVLGDSPSEIRFKQMPTRHNYKMMLKDRGLRPFEKGESTRPQVKDNTDRQVDQIMKLRQRRSALEIHRPQKSECH